MSKAIQVWDGSQFVPANVPVGAVPNAVTFYASASPTNAQVGTAWFDTSTNAIKIWSGSAWLQTSVDLNSYATKASPTFTGVSSFPDGSASAPSITNTGDANTGMFFPAEDTIAFSEGGIEAMRIDSSGRIIMPYQPTVIAGSSSGALSAGTHHIFGTSGNVWVNEGNHWNASTGRFTAPVSGRYFFNIFIRFSSESATSYNYLYITNSNSSQTGVPIRLWSPGGGTYRPHQLSYVLKLNQNDWADPRLVTTASVTNDGGSTGQTDSGMQIIFLG